MIDTDKYEGHTPAPWKASNEFYRSGIDEKNLGQVDSFRRTWGVTLREEQMDDSRENRIGYHAMHISDAKLIADAPLILEDYKRLRKEYKRLRKEYMELKEAIVGQSIAPATGEQIIDRCVNLTHEELIEEVLGYSPWEVIE